ncbi:MAG: EFR1 family ferrodoxin [Chloroflexota bacterium]
MRNIIVYFSQTGNTKKVAEAMQDAISEASGQCDITRLQDAGINDLAAYDLIGLGCPTFAREEPVNVRKFIRSMGPLKGKHCFVFSTHGGHPGDTLPSMAAKLRRQGLRVIGGFNCDASAHMPHFTLPWFTDGHPDAIDLKQAADFAREMVERSQRLYQGERPPLPKFQWVRSKLHKGLRKTTQANKPLSRGFEFEMTLDRKKCRYPRCHLCMDNCPVNAIDLSADPIIFRRGCISCYFCEMVCPTGAIEIDPQSAERQRRVRLKYFDKARYDRFFDRAKTELIDNRTTLYRQLADKVEIGNTHEMFAAHQRKRPRYIIRDRKK